MPEYLITIPEEKNKNFLKAVSRLTYATVTEKKIIPINIGTKKKIFTRGQLQFVKELKESLIEVELAEKGKIKLKSARDLLNEL